MHETVVRIGNYFRIITKCHGGFDTVEWPEEFLTEEQAWDHLDAIQGE